jgi:hypothetical protein
MTRTEYPELEEVLFEWIKYQRETGFSVSTDMLLERVRRLVRSSERSMRTKRHLCARKDISYEEWGRLSYGWAERFSESFNIMDTNLCGESCSSDTEDAWAYSTTFKRKQFYGRAWLQGGWDLYQKKKIGTKSVSPRCC